MMENTLLESLCPRLIARGVASAIAIAVAAAPAAAAQADAASARAYLQALYDRYQHESTFGVFGESEPQYFDAPTLALLQQDEKLLQGDEGAIGADYVCVCQDSGGMRATIDSVAMTGANQAKARITVRYPSERGAPTAHVDMDLAYEKGQWRIHDIHSKDTEGHDWEGLRDTLIKEISELSAAH